MRLGPHRPRLCVSEIRRRCRISWPSQNRWPAAFRSGAFIAQRTVRLGFPPGIARLDLRRRPAGLRDGARISHDRRGGRSARERSRRGAPSCAPGFEKLAAQFDFIREVRGEGLILGVDLTVEGAPFVAEALDSGLLINCTHDHVLRLLPPFIVQRAGRGRIPQRIRTVLARDGQTPRASRSRKSLRSRDAHAQPVAVGCVEVNMNALYPRRSHCRTICSPAPNGTRARCAISSSLAADIKAHPERYRTRAGRPVSGADFRKAVAAHARDF